MKKITHQPVQSIYAFDIKVAIAIFDASASFLREDLRFCELGAKAGETCAKAVGNLRFILRNVCKQRRETALQNLKVSQTSSTLILSMLN